MRSTSTAGDQDPSTDEQGIDAAVLAGVITETLLALQAQAALGVIPRELDHGESLRGQVHQASGMISEQLGIGIADALVRLRAHAYAEGRPVNAVAADVVARVLEDSVARRRDDGERERRVRWPHVQNFSPERSSTSPTRSSPTSTSSTS